MYDFDNKPKNDFSDGYGKPKNDYQYSPPERGGCLTALLGFIMVTNILGIFAMFVVVGDVSAYGSNSGLVSLILYGSVAISIAAAICAYGLWNWKRWGYNGLMVLYVLSIVITLIGSNPSSAAGSAAGLAMLYYLMKDKTHYLE